MMSEAIDQRIGVMVVITRLAVGGAPQNVLTAIAGLDPNRFRIVLVSGLPGKGEGSMIEEARKLDVPLHILPSLVRPPHPVKDLNALWSLWRLMRKEQVHIVHTHLSKAGILGRLAAWFARVPVIVHTYHGDVLEGYFSKLKSWIYTLVERLVGRVTDQFVCVSPELKDRLLDYRLGSEDAFRVISNGIDVTAFDLGEKSVGGRVGTLAMFYPIKRLDLFIHMAHRLRETHLQVAFEIAGDGMEAGALHQLSKSLENPVAFLGVCKDKREFFKDLDVFVLCSDFEGAGVGLMEAMASGIAVVATRVGGVPEIVQDGETGLLVLPNDIEALCGAVDKLLSDVALREQLGRSAKAYAQAHFSQQKMLEDLSAMYCELV